MSSCAIIYDDESLIKMAKKFEHFAHKLFKRFKVISNINARLWYCWINVSRRIVKFCIFNRKLFLTQIFLWVVFIKIILTLTPDFELNESFYFYNEIRFCSCNNSPETFAANSNIFKQILIVSKHGPNRISALYLYTLCIVPSLPTR